MNTWDEVIGQLAGIPTFPAHAAEATTESVRPDHRRHPRRTTRRRRIRPPRRNSTLPRLLSHQAVPRLARRLAAPRPAPRRHHRPNQRTKERHDMTTPSHI